MPSIIKVYAEVLMLASDLQMITKRIDWDLKLYGKYRLKNPRYLI